MWPTYGRTYLPGVDLLIVQAPLGDIDVDRRLAVAAGIGRFIWATN
jgi:hypothetical protein